MVKISGIKKTFDTVLRSKPFVKTVKFASDNPALFASAATLGFSTVVRPVSIYLTPNTNKDDKKISIIKSFASSLVGFGLSFAVSKPIEKAVKKIDAAPEKYLKSDTIKNLKGTENALLKSPKYLFSTQIFKASSSLLTAKPKSMLTCAMIPFIAKAIGDKKNKNNSNNKTSFGSGSKSQDFLSRGIGKLINTKALQKFTNKFHKTNLIQNISIMTDVILTAEFVHQVKKNKQIEENNKKTLISNSLFSTALSLITSVGLNKFSDKPAEKFIKHFLDVNKNLPNPEKYAQGIRAAKTVCVTGFVYYAIIPFLSMFMTSLVKPLSKNIHQKNS